MKGFRLGGVLRMRNLFEQQAAVDLAEAHRQEQRAKDRASATAAALGETTFPSDLDAAALRAGLASRMMLSAMLAETQTQVTAAAETTAIRTAEWTAARQATRSVERLAERHAEEARLDEERAEQRVLDEIASRRNPEVIV